MRKCYRLFRYLTLILCAAAVTAGCVRPRDTAPSQSQRAELILGFSQIGAESAWRKCNTRSIKQAAEESGVQLLFANAEQKQENQIKALRSFIAYQVDVIAFVPIVADGWDTVLQEAREAGIPVLITDRKIVTSDESLYAGFIGTDSEEEGRKCARFLLRKFSDRLAYGTAEHPIRIVELSGTEGSSPAIGRAIGFREVLSAYPQFSIVHSESGDFLRSKGYEIMRELLERRIEMDVIYSHNDGMTLGVIDAMRERGLRPGTDIVIVTIDAEQAAIDALRRGEVNCVVECNPKTGSAVMELARKLKNREPITKLLHVEEAMFSEYDDLSPIGPRGY